MIILNAKAAELKNTEAKTIIDYTTRSEPKKQPAKWIQWIKKNKQDILIVLIVFLIIAFIITMFLWSYGVFSIGVSGL
jgi:hypothetical protein